jgi:hypothetical protein
MVIVSLLDRLRNKRRPCRAPRQPEPWVARLAALEAGSFGALNLSCAIDETSHATTKL